MSVRRSAVRAYAEARGVRWRTDPTNADPRFVRNRVRAVLPELEAALDGLVPGIVRTAQQLRETRRAHRALRARVLEDRVRGSDRDVYVDLSGTSPDSSERADVLQMAVERWAALPGVDADRRLRRARATVERVATRGATADLPGGYRVERTRSGVLIAAPPRPIDPQMIAEASTGVGPWRVRLVSAPSVTLLDRDVFVGTPPFGLRTGRVGERFRPVGAPGSKSLRRRWRDLGVPTLFRAAVPVLTDGDDRPLWAGYLGAAEHARARRGAPGWRVELSLLEGSTAWPGLPK